MEQTHITAIVLAAGVGSRMKAEIPKQYMLIEDKPVLYYSLNSFENSTVDDIVLVVNEDDVLYCQENIVKKNHFTKIKSVIAGGSERYWSVRNGLKAAMGADYVLIHDAARPCLSVEVIEHSIETVKEVGACTVGVPVKDTIKLVDSELYGVDTPPRNNLWQVQTPQSFRYRDITAAYHLLEQSDKQDVTDDTMILERFLHKKTKMIFGDYHNIKITTPEDLWVAKIFLEKSEKSC